MATFTAIQNKKQTAGALFGVLDYATQDKKTRWEDTRLVSGHNCVPQSSFIEMETSKERFRKTGGKQFYHFVQSFSDEGWLGELAAGWFRVAAELERNEQWQLPAPPTWTDSKQRRREALKKMAMGQKFGGDQEHGFGQTL